jgi:zinc protease
MIIETEVDGVPTFLAAGDGPLRAGLVFRVGQADETLASRGITHLVEHLALYRHGLTDYHYNGATDLVLTSFHLEGDEDDVVGFLTGVGEALADLPVERLPQELEILRTEAAGHAYPPLPLWRYGTKGYGLASAREWGTHRITGDDARDWARTWFTRGNAALWICGDRVPPGLKLALPEGARMPVPAPTSALPSTPAYFTDEGPVLALTGIVPHGLPAQFYAAVLGRELDRVLRHDDGYCSDLLVDYSSRGDGRATVTVAAQALHHTRGAALGSIVDALARLRLGASDPADLEAVRSRAEQTWQDPDVARSQVVNWAANALTGQPNRTFEELAAQAAAITGDDLTAIGEAMSATALLRVPDHYTAEWAGFTPAPTFSPSAVDGAEVLPREAVDDLLVIGDEGISRLTPGGPLTVRYRDCQAQLRWPDGARRFLGPDGIVVDVQPTLWQLTADQVALLDRAVDEKVRVDLPARPAEEIPQPDPKARRTKKTPRPRVYREPYQDRSAAVEQQIWEADKADRVERARETRSMKVVARRDAATQKVRKRAAATVSLAVMTVSSFGFGVFWAPLVLGAATLASGLMLYYLNEQRRNSR